MWTFKATRLSSISRTKVVSAWITAEHLRLTPDTFCDNKNVAPDKMSGRSKVVANKTGFWLFQPDKYPRSGPISRLDTFANFFSTRIDEFTIIVRRELYCRGVKYNSKNNGYLAWEDKTKQYNWQVMVIVFLLCFLVRYSIWSKINGL